MPRITTWSGCWGEFPVPSARGEPGNSYIRRLEPGASAARAAKMAAPLPRGPKWWSRATKKGLPTSSCGAKCLGNGKTVEGTKSPAARDSSGTKFLGTKFLATRFLGTRFLQPSFSQPGFSEPGFCNQVSRTAFVTGGVMFGLSTVVTIWIFAGLGVMVILFLMSGMARLYRKAGPHEALIVYGLGGTRVVQGRGTLVFPMVQVCRDLSLELMSFDVAPQQDLYTKQGVAVTVEAVAQIKVKSDRESVLTAAEQFLTKTDQEREGLIRLVMEGHLRGIIGQLTVEEIVKQPEMVSDRMRGTCAEDMNKMGLEVISFTIKEVRDKNEYITNMGKPDVA